MSTFRMAPGLSAASGSKSRDPRFDPDSSFDQSTWRQKYDFLFEQQRQETEDMKRKLDASDAASRRAKQRGGGAKRQRTREKVLTPDEASKLRVELEQTKNRLAQDERQAKRQRLKAEVRKEEVEAVKQGKKPFFLKKSALRERELIAQYDELKKNPSKLEKFLTKRRRKNSAKQHKRMPARGVEYDE